MLKDAKQQRTGPSAEHFKIWQYVLSPPVEHVDLTADDLSNEGGSEERQGQASELDDPVAHHECEECYTPNDFVSIFMCDTFKQLLCVICDSYGLDDHQCWLCILSHCLSCRGDHLAACMRQATISETTQSVPEERDSSVLAMGSGISHACVTNASSSEDRGGLSEPERKRIKTKRGEALSIRSLKASVHELTLPATTLEVQSVLAGKGANGQEQDSNVATFAHQTQPVPVRRGEEGNLSCLSSCRQPSPCRSNQCLR